MSTARPAAATKGEDPTGERSLNHCRTAIYCTDIQERQIDFNIYSPGAATHTLEIGSRGSALVLGGAPVGQERIPDLNGDKRVDFQDFVRFANSGEREVLGEAESDMARILVIDDDAMVRQFCRDLLEQEGYDIEEATGGKVGLELYRRNPADLVMTDLVMPEMDGFEVVRTLRRDYPDAKIMAMSALLYDELPRATKLGADAVLEAPFGASKLRKIVRKLLHNAGLLISAR